MDTTIYTEKVSRIEAVVDDSDLPQDIKERIKDALQKEIDTGGSLEDLVDNIKKDVDRNLVVNQYMTVEQSFDEVKENLSLAYMYMSEAVTDLLSQIEGLEKGLLIPTIERNTVKVHTARHAPSYRTVDEYATAMKERKKKMTESGPSGNKKSPFRNMKLGNYRVQYLLEDYTLEFADLDEKLPKMKEKLQKLQSDLVQHTNRVTWLVTDQSGFRPNVRGRLSSTLGGEDTTVHGKEAIQIGKISKYINSVVYTINNADTLQAFSAADVEVGKNTIEAIESTDWYTRTKEVEKAAKVRIVGVNWNDYVAMNNDKIDISKHIDKVNDLWLYERKQIENPDYAMFTPMLNRIKLYFHAALSGVLKEQ